MNIKTPAPRAKSFIGIVCLTVCAVLSGPTEASEQIVAVEKTVNTADLDVGQPAGAQALYRRLWHAAYLVCGHGLRVGLEPVGDVMGCVEGAVGEAVRSANLPQLTMVYLKTHTAQQAATHRIDVPALMAAK